MRRCASDHGHCGHRTSQSATRTEASGSRGFTRKSKSTKVPQLSHAMTSHGCLAMSAAAIVGQNHVAPLAASRALKPLIDHVPE